MPSIFRWILFPHCLFSCVAQRDFYCVFCDVWRRGGARIFIRLAQRVCVHCCVYVGYGDHFQFVVPSICVNMLFVPLHVLHHVCVFQSPRKLMRPTKRYIALDFIPRAFSSSSSHQFFSTFSHPSVVFVCMIVIRLECAVLLVLRCAHSHFPENECKFINYVKIKIYCRWRFTRWFLAPHHHSPPSSSFSNPFENCMQSHDYANERIYATTKSTGYFSHGRNYDKLLFFLHFIAHAFLLMVVYIYSNKE